MTHFDYLVLEYADLIRQLEHKKAVVRILTQMLSTPAINHNDWVSFTKYLQQTYNLQLSGFNKMIINGEYTTCYFEHPQTQTYAYIYTTNNITLNLSTIAAMLQFYQTDYSEKDKLTDLKAAILASE